MPDTNPHPLPAKKNRIRPGMIKISVRLPMELHAAAALAAEQKNLYLMDWVRQLIERAVKRAA